ncbi:MAG: hypothetical protein AAF696_34065 [Bacteroidota bacterium]
MDVFEKIAQEHVESLGEYTPGFKCSFTNRREFCFYFIFDYSFIHIKTDKTARPPLAGGAVGFSIHKTSHKLTRLSFGDLGELEYRERKLEEAYQKLLALKSGEGSYTWLKAKYRLNSIELLRLKKILQKEELKKEEVLEKLEQWINKVKPE